MTDSRTQGLRAIAEQAAEWYLHVEEEAGVPLAEREAFVAWLKASPTHIEEFMRVRAMHTQIAALDVVNLPDVQQAFSEAGSNVIRLLAADGGVTHRPVTESGTRRSSMMWASAAAVATIALALTWFATQQLSSNPENVVAENVFETVLGEQRSVLLSDGSLVELNTQSKLRVLFIDDERRVELVAGEAVFDVAKNPDRPFRVDAGTAIVEAVGTRFNIYRQSTQTVVTVVEGVVEVTRPKSKGAPPIVGASGATAELPVVELRLGDQLAVPIVGAIAQPSVVDTDKAIAWTDRRLVFDGDSLATVAHELNRYNREQLVVSDPVLAQQSISGVFNANDPATLFKFLETVGGLRVETDPSGSGWTLHPGVVANPITEQR